MKRFFYILSLLLACAVEDAGRVEAGLYDLDAQNSDASTSMRWP